MKPLNLLKMLPRNQPQTSTVGFTMFELMVVVVIIGILSAIAVPGWNAFINNQRTRTVNDGVFRALRSAQSDAKLKKAKRIVEFCYKKDGKTNPNTDKPYNDPPRFIIYPDQEDNDDDIPNDDLRWQSLGANGEIKAGMVELATGKCANDDCSNGFITNTNTIIFNNFFFFMKRRIILFFKKCFFLIKRSKIYIIIFNIFMKIFYA